MKRSGKEVTEDHAAAMDWASLGARVQRLTEEAIRIHREEENAAGRLQGVPFLRLVRAVEEQAENEPAVCETGSAA